ncbi:hypothetical protein D3C72_2197640 [compost metagenome]
MLRCQICEMAAASAALPQAAPMALWKARSCTLGDSVSDMPSCATRIAAICAGDAFCAASAAHSGSISRRVSSRSKGPMSVASTLSAAGGGGVSW